MDTLLEGLDHYNEHTRARYADMFSKLSKGQAPEALLVTCADSRIVPNLITSTDPGDIFIVRNVGGLVPSPSSGDTSVASAIAYAVEVLGVRDVIVCGHSGCGAMGALLSGHAPPAVSGWLSHAHEALEAFRSSPRASADKNLPEIDRLSQEVTLRQLDHVAAHESVNLNVRLHAWWFDVASGGVHVYDRDQNLFVPSDKAAESRAA